MLKVQAGVCLLQFIPIRHGMMYRWHNPFFILSDLGQHPVILAGIYDRLALRTFGNIKDFYGTATVRATPLEVDADGLVFAPGLRENDQISVKLVRVRSLFPETRFAVSRSSL